MLFAVFCIIYCSIVNWDQCGGRIETCGHFDEYHFDENTEYVTEQICTVIETIYDTSTADCYVCGCNLLVVNFSKLTAD